MSAKPDSLDLDELHAALAMRQPALVLLRYRSALVLDEHLRALRLLLAPRALHELRFRGVTDRPHAEVAELMDKARRLADATIPVVCLRPEPGADAESPVLAEFWKLMNGQREAMGALPAILLLCLDDAHTPAAYHHARDLMSWFAPKFACTSMTPITSEPRSSRLEIERSPSGTGGRSAWDSLYPLWRHVLATGKPITTDHTTRILLPLLGAAVDNGMVSEGHALIAQADALQIPFRDEHQRSVWLERCGDLAMAQGDLRAALRRFQESLAIRERLVASAPSNAGWLRDLTESLSKVGDVLRAQGDLVGALASFRQALDVRRGLAQADPSNAGWQRDLTASLDRVGDVLRAQGDLVGALASFRQSLDVSRGLAQADPSNAWWQRDLAVSLNKVGDVLRAQGDLVGALASFRQSLDVSRGLAQADPSNAGWQRDLTVSLYGLGDVLLAQGDPRSALAHGLEAQRIAETLASLDPSNATWQKDVAFIRPLVERARRTLG